MRFVFAYKRNVVDDCPRQVFCSGGRVVVLMGEQCCVAEGVGAQSVWWIGDDAVGAMSASPMGSESTVRSISRQLIELTSARPPIHSFNRQFLRLLLDATEALSATLWLIQQNELVRSEEIEQSVGAVRDIKLSSQDQQRALRGAFENGEVAIRDNRAAVFDPLLSEEMADRSIVFCPIFGPKANFGVIRLVFPPMPEASLAPKVVLAEAIGGYYTLYAAERLLQVRHEERQDIDRLSKAILQLQHFTFSRSLPEVVVASAMEIAPQLDRITLLSADKKGRLAVAGVSSVSVPDKKSPWARLLCDIGAIILQRGEPLQFLPGRSDSSEIEEPELREYLNSYAVMTGIRSLLIYPLRSGESDVGVIVFESFQEQSLSGFEKTLCTVFAAHVGSALGNYAAYRNMPLARLFAGGLQEAQRRDRRGHFGLGTALKSILGLALAGGVVWFVGFKKVPESVNARCYVAPYTSRLITAKVAGEIEQVNFKHGQVVRESQVLIEQKSDQIELALAKALQNIKTIKVNINMLRGEADKPQAPERRGELLAQMRALEYTLSGEQHEVDILRQQLADCTLAAPITGTVIAPENPDELLGVVVRPGEPLCEIGEIQHKVRIKIAIPEADAQDVAEGQEVQISLQPLVTGQTIVGAIEKVASRSTTYKNSNVFIADVIVENHRIGTEGGADGSDYLLKPGMTGKAKIKKGDDSTYLKIYAGMLKRKFQYWLF